MRPFLDGNNGESSHVVVNNAFELQTNCYIEAKKSNNRLNCVHWVRARQTLYQVRSIEFLMFFRTFIIWKSNGGSQRLKIMQPCTAQATKPCKHRARHLNMRAFPGRAGPPESGFRVLYVSVFQQKLNTLLRISPHKLQSSS